MSKNQEYVKQYAEYAMEQMRRYGIPASVTLAQGICESASGQSELSRKGNNHFGIKATSGWVQNGGKYLAQPTNPVECVQSLTQKHVAKRYMIGEKFLPLRHES